ncbi:NAD(P)/FAD-dependent oxidoreductase [Facklamia languida]
MLTDILIIGAGPVGLYTAFYAQMRKASVKVLDSLKAPGGQPAHIYGEKLIYDIPGYPSITGTELTQQLLNQLSRFETDFCLGQEVLMITKNDQGIFEIQTNQTTHYAKSVIIATGNGAFQPRKLNIDNAPEYEDQSLHYIIKNPEDFRGKTVALAGGGDSAVDWALTLEDIADRVYLIHRRDQFRALEYSVERLEHSSVQQIKPYLIKALQGELGQLTGLHLERAKSKDPLFLEVDQLVVNYGFSTSLNSAKKWGVAIQHNQVQVDCHMETTVKGIFAVGDIAHYDGKVKIIASGFGEAPLAVNQALYYANPSYQPSPIHSSSLFEGEIF